MTFRRALLATAFCVSFLLVALDLGLDHYGISSDEAAYGQASQLHVGWFTTWGEPGWLSQETIDEHFAWNPVVVVHPNFSRLASGVSWALFHGVFGADELVSLRLHNALAYALTGVGVVGFALFRFGTLTGVVALLMFWANIRFFGHAHTALTDMTLACVWLWATLLLAESIRKDSVGLAALAAFVTGLAVATKLTGVLLLGLLIGWMVLFQGKRAWKSLLLLILIPPLVFYALTPQAWQHPIDWTLDFFSQFAARENTARIPTMFMGERYMHRVPWYVPGVHALITTGPALLLLIATAAVAGCLDLIRRGRSGVRSWLQGPHGLYLAAGILPLVATSFPSVPAHDLERLFLPLQPFLVMYAAYGFWAVSQSSLLRKFIDRVPDTASSLVLPALAAALCVPSLVEAARQHPYHLGYFNAFVGGAPGAENRGYDVAYLKLEANAEVLEALNQYVGPGQRVFSGFLHQDLLEHQRAGRVRADIEFTQGRADFLLLHVRRSWMSPFEELLYEQKPDPVWALRHRGVDLVVLYDLDSVVRYLDSELGR